MFLSKAFLASMLLLTAAGCAQVHEKMFTLDCAVGRAPLAGELAPGTAMALEFDQPNPTPLPVASRDRAMRQRRHRNDEYRNSGRHRPEPALNPTKHCRQPHDLRTVKKQTPASKRFSSMSSKIKNVLSLSPLQKGEGSGVRFRSALLLFCASAIALAGCAQQGGGLLQPTPKQIISGKNTIVPSAAALSMEATNFCNAQAQVDYAGLVLYCEGKTPALPLSINTTYADREQPVLVPGVRLHQFEQSADSAADRDSR